MLAGAVGAALVVAAVYVTLPKFSVREVVVDHVVPKDVQVGHVVTRDVSVNNIIPKDVTIEIPKFVTKAEHDFISRPEFESAQFKGRLVEDPEGRIRSTAATSSSQ